MDELTTAEHHALEAWRPFVPPPGFAERVVTLRAKPRTLRAPLVAGALVAAAAVIVILLGTERPSSQAALPSRPPRPAMEVRSLVPDLRVQAGETFTVHDRRGEVVVELGFARPCPERRLELEHAGVDAPRVLTGDATKLLALTTGTWIYKLRCAPDGPDAAIGGITVLQDAADRPMRRGPTSLAIDLERDNQSIKFPWTAPDLVVKLPDGGTRWSLDVEPVGGKGFRLESATPSITVRAALLDGYFYKLVGWRDGVAVGSTTLMLSLEDDAPTVSIQSAISGTTRTITGTIRPGWTVAVDGQPVELDSLGGFTASVTLPSPRAIAVAVKYPRLGTNYYLLR